MSKLVILTVGLPRSGKSTWARLFSQVHGVPHVSSDAVRVAFYGHPFIRKAEAWVWPMIRVMVEALFLAGHDVVIVDATTTTKKDRDWWKDDNWEVVFKPITTTPEECLARAERAENTGEVPQGLVAIVHQKIRTFEILTEEELTRVIKE
jgi:predicted kinase